MQLKNGHGHEQINTDGQKDYYSNDHGTIDSMVQRQRKSGRFEIVEGSKIQTKVETMEGGLHTNGLKSIIFQMKLKQIQKRNISFKYLS